MCYPQKFDRNETYSTKFLPNDDTNEQDKNNNDGSSDDPLFVHPEFKLSEKSVREGLAFAR